MAEKPIFRGKSDYQILNLKAIDQADCKIL